MHRLPSSFAYLTASSIDIVDAAYWTTESPCPTCSDGQSESGIPTRQTMHMPDERFHSLSRRSAPTIVLNAARILRARSSISCCGLPTVKFISIDVLIGFGPVLKTLGQDRPFLTFNHMIGVKPRERLV